MDKLLKFMFSKKATKIGEIFTVDLTLCSKCHTNFNNRLFYGNEKSKFAVKMHSFLFCITFQTRNKTIKLFSFKREEIQIQLCQPINSVNSHPFCNNSYFWMIFLKTGHILLSVSDVPTKLNFKWCEAVQPPLKKGDKFNVSHFLSRAQWDEMFSRGATKNTAD